MAGYQIEYKKSVAKDLRKLPIRDLKVLIEQILNLKENPRPKGYVKLRGSQGLYRIRQGDYRVIYSIHDDALMILIIKVGHRKDIYGH